MGSHEEVQDILTSGLHTAVRRARLAWDSNGAGLQVTVDEIKALVRKLENGISYRSGTYHEPERFLSAPKTGDNQPPIRRSSSTYSEGPSNRRGRPDNLERQGSAESYHSSRNGSYNRERETFPAVESGSPHSSLRSSNARTASNPPVTSPAPSADRSAGGRLGRGRTGQQQTSSSRSTTWRQYQPKNGNSSRQEQNSSSRQRQRQDDPKKSSTKSYAERRKEILQRRDALAAAEKNKARNRYAYRKPEKESEIRNPSRRRIERRASPLFSHPHGN